MNRLAIIIPVLNQWAFTEACLKSLRKHTPGNYYQVIVVDNGSSDETAEQCPQLLAALFPGKQVYLRQEKNLAFGPACNLGSNAADAELLFFLNNDTELTKGWPDPLFKALRDDSRLGAVSPLLLYPDTMRVQHLGVAFDPNLHPMHLFEGFPANHPATLRPRLLQAVSAAALFMPHDLFHDCGGFHEGFVNGSEDLDLCSQLARRGLRVACEPRSVVLHHTSKTQGRFEHVKANAKLLGKRCRGCFITDLHRFARKEGFEVHLSPWLEPYLSVPLAFSPDVAASELPEFLLEHPLYETGYIDLVKSLEIEGDLAAALEWMELCASFTPRMAHFSCAARLAVANQDHTRVNRWLDRLSHVQTMLANRPALEGRAKKNRDLFCKWADDELAALYQGWLDLRALEKVALPIFGKLFGL